MAEYDTMEPFEWAVFCGGCGVMPATSKDEKVARLTWNTRAAFLSEAELKKLEEIL